MGFFVQYGNTQTVSLGVGKFGGTSNHSHSGQSKSNEQSCTSSTAREAKINHGKCARTDDPESNAAKRTEMTSQLDSITMQMAEVTITQIEERAKIVLQESVGKLIENYMAHDHDIIDALVDKH